MLCGSRVIKVTIDIPDWLEKLIIKPILLYRRIRYGYAFRRIPLTQGKFAIVDPDDYERLKKYKWYAHRCGNIFYAVRWQWCKTTKKQKHISMHKLIIDVPHGFVVDHINHNGLDNRKANLRPATITQNNRHTKKTKNKFCSDYKGVSWHSREKRWVVKITSDGIRRTIGYFKDEIEAAKAYDEAAKKYHKEFAVLNFDS